MRTSTRRPRLKHTNGAPKRTRTRSTSKARSSPLTTGRSESPSPSAPVIEAICIDLRERFGDRYRIAFEEQYRRWPQRDWPWLARIRCRHGFVAPFGGELLQAFTGRPRIGRRLRSLPFVLHARGDHETVIRFHISDVAEVLAILQPRRRRPALGDEQKARLIADGQAALTRWRAQAKAQSAQTRLESPRSSKTEERGRPMTSNATERPGRAPVPKRTGAPARRPMPIGGWWANRAVEPTGLDDLCIHCHRCGEGFIETRLLMKHRCTVDAPRSINTVK